jgi:hypothetical protein
VLAGAALMLFWQYFSGRTPQVAIPKLEAPKLETHKLEGEVFIVTKGGQSIKLGLVEVALLPLEPLLPYLAEKKAAEESIAAQLDSEIEAAKADEKSKDARLQAARSYDVLSKAGSEAYTKAYNEYYRANYFCEDLLGKRRAFPSGSYYFRNLPQSIVSTQTDSDGKFTIEVPAQGEFALAARSQRSVGSSVENYFWLVKVSPDQHAKKLMLSNGNLSFSGSPDSLIVTKR